jgi:uncharacterized protein YjbI with pentapeptide repeats
MANPEQLAILKRSIEARNLWREKHPAIRPDYSSTDLAGIDLSRANLCRIDFFGMNLSGANLSGSDLYGANLLDSDLSGANLDGMNIAGAGLGSTIFDNVDLSEVRGLETVTHLGPSSIGIDTIYKSKGKIPLVFLRGTGVPEDFIKNMKFMDFTGNKFYSPFISYSTKDQEFAEWLYADL